MKGLCMDTKFDSVLSNWSMPEQAHQAGHAALLVNTGI